MSENKHTNKLIQEKSPYLLQHAHNPVDWYPWGDEAFQKAASEDKPIFLSIGYSTCHWCQLIFYLHRPQKIALNNINSIKILFQNPLGNTIELVDNQKENIYKIINDLEVSNNLINPLPDRFSGDYLYQITIFETSNHYYIYCMPNGDPQFNKKPFACVSGTITGMVSNPKDLLDFVKGFKND